MLTSTTLTMTTCTNLVVKRTIYFVLFCTKNTSKMTSRHDVTVDAKLCAAQDVLRLRGCREDEKEKEKEEEVGRLKSRV
jgi:hypothetical protein